MRIDQVRLPIRVALEEVPLGLVVGAKLIVDLVGSANAGYRLRRLSGHCLEPGRLLEVGILSFGPILRLHRADHRCWG